MPPPEVADDAQVVGAAAGRGQVAIPAGGHQGPRAKIRCLVDAPADQRERAPGVERVPLDGLLVALARLVQRPIQPPLAFVVTPQPRLRGPVQQREARRKLQLAPGACAQVLDDLGVVAGCGELPRLFDYE